MNQSNATPSASKARPSLFHYIALGAALLGVFLLWRQQTETRQSLLEILEQKQALEEELKSTKAELDDMKSGDSSVESRERLAATRKEKISAPEEVETFFLQNPTVHQTARGLAVKFEFKPGDHIELPDQITLVVRASGDTSTKILSFKPVSEPGYSSITHLVNAKGDLGLIEGSPSDLNALAFELLVSGPVRVIVRGSEGIMDFELEITPSGCNVRPL